MSGRHAAPRSWWSTFADDFWFGVALYVAVFYSLGARRARAR